MDCSKDQATDPSSGEEIDTVETLIKSLYIEKGQRKQPRVNQNNKNPFKRKFTRKQKRKLSICYNLSQCKDILDKLGTAPSSSTSCKKDKESKVMLKITDKMAKLWGEDGYREMMPTVPVLRIHQKSTSSSVSDCKKDNNASASTASNEETSENYTNQVSSQTCARQAMYDYCDSVTELAAYLDEALFIPRKMSFMAEMMYT